MAVFQVVVFILYSLSTVDIKSRSQPASPSPSLNSVSAAGV